MHLELVDAYATPADLEGAPLDWKINQTYMLDLTQSEETLLGRMNNYRRRDIRRAERNGLVVEECHDMNMADDFSSQLKDVFAKQGLVPTFGIERVRALIEHLESTGMLLMLRARNSEGKCIATGIYLGMNEAALYWGGASWREYQGLHPNEMLQWYAMRYWKKRGMKTYNLVGTMDFKARFGGDLVSVPSVSTSRNWLVKTMRVAAPAMRLAWKVKGSGTKKSKSPAPASQVET
jgi:lipid II:glycine glycyltransferase (peptidoglycan interpeptide bridge formation enzyme)